MMLKFGRIVDLDNLEGLGVNHIVEGLRSKLREIQRKGERDVAALESEIRAERKKLAAVTRENTEGLNRIYELRLEMQRQEKRMEARQKSMVSCSVL